MDRIKDRTGCRILAYPGEISSFHRRPGGTKRTRERWHLSKGGKHSIHATCDDNVTGLSATRARFRYRGFFLPFARKHYSVDLIAYRGNTYISLTYPFFIDIASEIIAISYTISFPFDKISFTKTNINCNISLIIFYFYPHKE